MVLHQMLYEKIAMATNAAHVMAEVFCVNRPFSISSWYICYIVAAINTIHLVYCNSNKFYITFVEITWSYLIYLLLSIKIFGIRRLYAGTISSICRCCEDCLNNFITFIWYTSNAIVLLFNVFTWKTYSSIIQWGDEYFSE